MAYSPIIPNHFLERFAAALRMEPDSRTTDLTNGIAARTADPLWYLTRQWQISEFEGEDAGSPVDVNVNYKTRSLKSIKLRNDEGEIISDKGSQQNGPLPMEKLIEQEWLKIDWKISAQLGQEFEKQISMLIEDKEEAAGFIYSYRNAFPFKFSDLKQEMNADENTRRFVQFMQGRIVNGHALLLGLDFKSYALTLARDNLTLVLPNDINSVIAGKLIKWCEAMNIKNNPERSKAWRNEQLDYHFNLDTGENEDDEEKTLIAPAYRSGSLDWYTFDACKEIHKDQKWTEHSRSNLLPTSINILGISRRWWEFEDAEIDFGHLEVGKIDLARALLMEYALVYGDDWFSVPLPVEVSNMIKITDLSIRNVFGQTEIIEPAFNINRELNEKDGTTLDDPLNKFGIFNLTPAPGSEDIILAENPVLYIPPVLSFRQESDPLEEARFIRDEWSNMVWCIEHKVLNGLGKAIDGYKAQLEYFEARKLERLDQLPSEIENLRAESAELDPATTAYAESQILLEGKLLELKRLSPDLAHDESSLPEYRLATSVPENWIPFKPYNTGNVFEGEMNVRLRRAQMLRNTFSEDPEPIQAKTRLLEISGNPLLWLEESIIPRSGLRICMTNQRTRWTDGQTFVWKGRKVLAGKGEGESGLTFDKVFNL